MGNLASSVKVIKTCKEKEDINLDKWEWNRLIFKTSLENPEWLSHGLVR